MTHYGLVSYMCYGERRRETLHAGVSCIIDARACRRSDALFPHMFPMRRGPFIHWWHTGGSVGKPAAEHTLAYTLQKGIVYCTAPTHTRHFTRCFQKQKYVSQGKPDSRCPRTTHLFPICLITEKLQALTEMDSFSLIGWLWWVFYKWLI